MTTSLKPKIFISYAHADGKTEVKDFWTHLNDYLKSDTRTWDKWDDTQIAVGEEWDSIIQKALKSGCNCCLLLVSDLFGKSSYIINKEWPVTLERFETEGIVFFPVTFGVLESELNGLPEQLKQIKKFQIYYPSVTDLYKIPPPNVTRPDETRLCYKELDNNSAKDRFVSKLAIRMNTRFDEYIENDKAKKKVQALVFQSNRKKSQVDLSLFFTNADCYDSLAKKMFGSFSFEKRYRDSKSKEHYFPRAVDAKLDESLQNKGWILIEGHPLAGKTRAAFESIIRLINSGNSIALWPFSVPESKQQELLLPLFPEADYQIVWMDDFDSLLRSLSDRGYSSNNINLLLKKIADSQLILIATAKTGPIYRDLRYRFGLVDQLWDKLESFLIERISGKEEKIFSKWYQNIFNEELSSRFDHNPGSLFLDLHTMENRWENIGESLKESHPTVSAEHLRDILKALHIFYIMEAYSVGGFFIEEDVRYYLLVILQYQQKKSPMGMAFSQVLESRDKPFEGRQWEELIELLTQDRFNLGFLRREGRYLVTETAYLDYIVGPKGEKKIADGLNKALSKEDQSKLGLSITSYNFADIFAKQSPRNEVQLKKLIRKLKPLGFERDISVWNQLIGLCQTQELANIAMALLRQENLKPNKTTYFILVQKTFSTDALLHIIEEIKGDDILVDDFFYVKLINSAQNFEVAKMLIAQIKDLGEVPSIHIYYKLLQKSSSFTEAQSVLDEMIEEKLKPNSITYDGVLAKAPDYPAAQKVLENMKKERVKPNLIIYGSLLQKAPDYLTALEILKEIKKDGLKPNFSTYVHVLQRVTDYSVAKKTLKDMKNEGVKFDSSIYDHVLQKVPDYSTALEVLENMKKERVRPNLAIYNHVLQKVPSYSIAQAVLEDMQTAGVKPNSVTYNNVLQKVSSYSIVQEVLEDMKKEGVKPNSVTYDHVLQRVPSYLIAQKVLEDMKMAGVKLNLSAYTYVLLKAPDYSTTQEVLKNMEKEGVRPTLNTFSICLRKIVSFNEVKSEIKKLKSSGFSIPKVHYFYHLIRTADNYEISRKIFDEMLSESINPSIGILNLMIKRSPTKEIAKSLFKEMNKFSLKPNEITNELLFEIGLNELINTA